MLNKLYYEKAGVSQEEQTQTQEQEGDIAAM